MSIRVAVIEPSGRLYGSEYSLLDIVDGLDRDEFDWRVFLPPDNGFSSLLEARNIACEKVYPNDLAALSRLERAILYARVFWRLRRLKPKVLYVNQTGSLKSAAFYARKLKLPMVVQVQTLEDARWLSERPNLHRDVLAFLCNSDFIAEVTDVPADRKCVAYYGIPTVRYESSVDNSGRFQGASAPLTFGLLGRIAVSKGHYLLLDAIERLGPLLPDAKFMIIGEGLTHQDTQQFTDEVRKRGLESRFVFRGYQTDIANELSAVDVLLIPSIAEPLGRVLYDAAEFGVPVIASDAGGLGEVCRRFDIGESFESENADALAAAMIKVANDPNAVTKRFHQDASAMLRSLNIDGYLKQIRTVLVNAAENRSSSFRWYGEPTGDESRTKVEGPQ